METTRPFKKGELKKFTDLIKLIKTVYDDGAFFINVNNDILCFDRENIMEENQSSIFKYSYFIIRETSIIPEELNNSTISIKNLIVAINDRVKSIKVDGANIAFTDGKSNKDILVGTRIENSIKNISLYTKEIQNKFGNIDDGSEFSKWIEESDIEKLIEYHLVTIRPDGVDFGPALVITRKGFPNIKKLSSCLVGWNSSSNEEMNCSINALYSSIPGNIMFVNYLKVLKI